MMNFKSSARIYPGRKGGTDNVAPSAIETSFIAIDGQRSCASETEKPKFFKFAPPTPFLCRQREGHETPPPPGGRRSPAARSPAQKIGALHAPGSRPSAEPLAWRNGGGVRAQSRVSYFFFGGGRGFHAPRGRAPVRAAQPPPPRPAADDFVRPEAFSPARPSARRMGAGARRKPRFRTGVPEITRIGKALCVILGEFPAKTLPQLHHRK